MGTTCLHLTFLMDADLNFDIDIKKQPNILKNIESFKDLMSKQYAEKVSSLVDLTAVTVFLQDDQRKIYQETAALSELVGFSNPKKEEPHQCSSEVSPLAACLPDDRL